MGKGFRYFHLNVGCWPDPDEILDDYESRLFSCPVCGAASIEPCYNSSGEVLDYHHHPERYATLPDIYIEEGKEARPSYRKTPFEIRSDIVRYKVSQHQPLTPRELECQKKMEQDKSKNWVVFKAESKKIEEEPRRIMMIQRPMKLSTERPALRDLKNLPVSVKTDLTGKIFGNLTVVGLSLYWERNSPLWAVRCICGNYDFMPRGLLVPKDDDWGVTMCSECVPIIAKP